MNRISEDFGPPSGMGPAVPATPPSDGSGDVFTNDVSHGFVPAKKRRKKKRMKHVTSYDEYQSKD